MESDMAMQLYSTLGKKGPSMKRGDWKARKGEGGTERAIRG